MPNSTLWRSMVLLMLAVIPCGLAAQTTFTVTVGNKTQSNPYFGMGSSFTFYINGNEAPQLHLVRGTTYTFQMEGVPSFHPFYLTTSDVGEGLGQYDEGVVGNQASGNQTLTFTPSATSPDFLFYQCANHQYMGWQILISGSAGVDVQNTSAPEINAYPNPFASQVTLAMTLPRAMHVRVSLCDLFGTPLRTVHDGTVEAGTPTALNVDGAGLAAGVYELRIIGENFARVQRVVLAH